MRHIIVGFMLIFSSVAFGQELYVYGYNPVDEAYTTFLGLFDAPPDNELSIWNPNGKYSKSKFPFSIWDKKSLYGRFDSPYSPWNENASKPPLIAYGKCDRLTYNDGDWVYVFSNNSKKTVSQFVNLCTVISIGFDKIPDALPEIYCQLIKDYIFLKMEY